MSSPKWTPEQEQAIAAGGTNILVAAAAGAGKTATLVERIIRRLADPVSELEVDQLLVVTFTEAAATEMRDRIGAALQKALADDPDNRRLQRQLALLGRASISTLHSFCLNLIRRYFYRLGLDPALTVMNEHEALLLRHEVLDALFAERFDAEDGEPDGSFYALVERYGGKDGEGLKALLLQVYDYAQSLPWPDAWLAEAVARFDVPAGRIVEETIWWPPIAATVRMELTRAAAALDTALGLTHRPGGPVGYAGLLEAERAGILRAAQAAGPEGTGWEGLSQAVSAVAFGRLTPAKDVDEALKEQAQTQRDQAKKIVAKLKETYFQRTGDEWLADLKGVAPHLITLADVVREFGRRFREAKAEQGAVDFNDLERFALQLLLDETASPGDLRPSTVARDLRSQYAEVLVDEYQDINGVQDAILSLTAREDQPNRFMVGDVKQSIYRFRHADPSLFLAKYQAYAPWAGLPKTPAEAVRSEAGAAPHPAADTVPNAAPDPTAAEAAVTAETSAGEGRRIVLGANFRSRRGVVDAVNFLFRQILTPVVGELAYDRDAELVCKAGYPPLPGLPEELDHPVELHLLDRPATKAGAASDESPADGATADGATADGATADEAEAEPEPADAAILDELADMSAAEREARLVARRIRELVDGTPEQPALQVWDRGLNSYRPLKYRDIVILLRATTGRADIFLEAMGQAGVPAYAQLSTGYFAATEVAVVLSLLQVLDNPRQDIPLAAVLRSPIVGLCSADLARIRLAAPKGSFYDAVATAAKERAFPALARFLSVLGQWRTAARQKPLSQVIWRVYQETGYLRFVGGMPGGVQRHANLLALYDRARQFDQFARQGLFRFLRFIERLRESDTDLGAAPALGEGEDVVRVMSIHKSKGLEFPVVFVANLGARFSGQDLKGDLLLHRELGFGPHVVDPDLRVKYPTVACHAVREAIRLGALAEELRVLYVALTRARERLILVGSPGGREALSDSLIRWTGSAMQPGWGLPDSVLAAARCYLDWIVPAAARHGSAALLRPAGLPDRFLNPAVAGDPVRWDVRLWNLEAQQALVRSESPDAAVQVDWVRVRALQPLDRTAVSDAPDRLRGRFAWPYPHAALARRFAKQTVTELKGHFDPDAAQPLPQLSPEESAGGAAVPPQRRSAASAAGEQGGTAPRRLDRRPSFLQESRKTLTPTEFGTLMHLVLQHLDLTRSLDLPDVEAQIQSLAERELIAPAQAAAADAAMIAGFFDTPLGRRVREYPERVRREVSFTLGLPAGEVYPDLPPETAAGEVVVVQGMIDVLVELDDGFLLIDYKTDKRDPEEAARAYQGQIRLYRRAVEEILGRPVREAYLHFLMENRAVRAF